MFDYGTLTQRGFTRKGVQLFLCTPCAIIALMLFFLIVGKIIVMVLTALSQAYAEALRLYAAQVPLLQLVLFVVVTYAALRFFAWAYREISMEVAYFRADRQSEAFLRANGYVRGWVHVG